jgi:hypothetical protein
VQAAPPKDAPPKEASMKAAPSKAAPSKAAPVQATQGQTKDAPSTVKSPVKPSSTAGTAPKGNAPAASVPTSTAPTSTAKTTPPTASNSTIPLDLVALEKQLKDTKAIGVFSKIALKNQVDDLMKKFRDHYKGKGKATMADLRQSYDLLMMKVLTMVQDNDKNLAAAIVSSRAAIWDLLADPVKFAALDA